MAPKPRNEGKQTRKIIWEKKKNDFHVATIKEYDTDKEMFKAFFTQWPDTSVDVPTNVPERTYPDIILLSEISRLLPIN